MAEGDVLHVDVVAADRRVWEGEALSVIARTTEGDVGVLPNHEPFLALLVPCAAEVLTRDGRREIIAVDGGFLSVADNRVSVLSAYAQLADEITMPEAERELGIAEKNLNEGEVTTANQQHFNRATAQLKAAQKVQAGR